MSKIISKSKDIELIALQKIETAPRVVIGERSVLDTAVEELTLFIRLGRQSETGFTAGVNLRVDASPKSSGAFWCPITTLTTNLGSSVGSESVTAGAAGQKDLTVASTTNFAVGDIVFINNTTLAYSEFGRVKAITTNTTITLEDNLEYDQAGSTVYDQAELYAISLDVTTYARVRVVVDGSGAGVNFVAEVKLCETR